MSIAHFYVIRVNSWSMCSFVVCPTEQSISAFAHARMFGNERMQNFTTYIPAQRSFCRMFSVERFEQAVAFHQTVLYSVYLTYFSGNYQRPSFLSFLGYSLSITIIEHRSVQLDLISCTVATNDIVKLAVQSTQPASESENATNLYCNLSVILTQSITGWYVLSWIQTLPRPVGILWAAQKTFDSWMDRRPSFCGRFPPGWLLGPPGKLLWLHVRETCCRVVAAVAGRKVFKSVGNDGDQVR